MKTMKNTIKLIGFIALVAVIGFSMAACNNGGGGGGGGKSSSGGTTTGGTTTSVTLNSVTPNGSGTVTTTALTLTFSQAITGLSASDITLTAGTTGATKGTLSGSGPIYTLNISGVKAGGDLSVRVTKTGYTIGGSPKTVKINYYSSSSGSTAVTFSGVTANGNSSTTTTALTLTFSQAIAGLTANDITLGGVAKATKGTLTNSGAIYTLPITVTVGGSMTVAVAKSGYNISNPSRTVTISYSSSSGGTGNEWTRINNYNAVKFPPGYDSFAFYTKGVAYGNGRFVAVGAAGMMAYSSDGISWTPITDTMESNSTVYNSIAYGGGMFVAVGEGGDRRMAYSSDGIKWTNTQDGRRGDNVVYGKDRFVMVTNNSRQVSYSTDGKNWVVVLDYALDSGGPDSGITAIAYGNGRFVVGGVYGKMAYSTDGTAWTQVSNSPFPEIETPDEANVIWAITYGGDKFVAGGTNGRMAYSTDGINWTKVPTTTFEDNEYVRSTIHAITYGGGKFVAGGNGKMAQSTNGINWTAITPPPFRWDNSYSESVRDIAYGNGRFVAINLNFIVYSK